MTEPTPEGVARGQLRTINLAVAESPVLHRFVVRIREHARHHREPETCEACYAWSEYHDGLVALTNVLREKGLT